MIRENYIGTRFGTRVCVDQIKVPKRGTKLILKCDCGRTGTATPRDARGRGCVSCARATHGYSPAGGSRTPTYQSWRAMIARCTNEKRKSFKRYGGAGITICDKWRTFPGFLEDMGERPEGTSLDRINNDLGYSKENCRWASYKQQQRNKKSTAYLTVRGEKKSIAEWSEVTGISWQTINSRLRMGWTEDRILSPAQQKYRNFKSK